MMKQPMREKDSQTIGKENKRKRNREQERKTRKPVGQCLVEYNSLRYRTRERAQEKERKTEEKKI